MCVVQTLQNPLARGKREMDVVESVHRNDERDLGHALEKRQHMVFSSSDAPNAVQALHRHLDRSVVHDKPCDT